MNKILIDNVLNDQKEYLERLRKQKLVTRKEESKINLESRLAQVVIGVRRSGKSTLCFQALEKAGVEYGYVNFDDERLADLDTLELNEVLAGVYRTYGDVDYLFFDEIQNAENWPLFVNRLLRDGRHLVITGSNSKLLSHELASHLTGRHHKIELFPFSFADWCHIHQVELPARSTLRKALLERAFNEYLRYGGLPELVYEKSETDKKEYVDTLFHNILEQDVRKRFHVRNTPELVKLANLMLNEAPSIMAKEALKEACGIHSDSTVTRYISFLSQTYLISTLSKYSVKSRQRARGDKYYAIDVAFMDKRENAFAGANLGWRLETLVYLELRRRYTLHDIYYYKDESTECDFVVCLGNRPVAAFQVCYDLSNPKTLNRELRGCKAALSKLHCPEVYLLNMSLQQDIEAPNGTILLRSACEWLAQE